MARRMQANGYEFFLSDPNATEEFVELFRADVQIDDLTDGKTIVEHNERYTVVKIVEQAIFYSNQDPPDVTQFCEKVWAAVSLCLRECCLKKFGVLLCSNRSKGELIDMLKLGLEKKQDMIFLKNTWLQCEKAFHESLSFLGKEKREELLVAVKRFQRLVDEADADTVKEQLFANPLKSVEKTIVTLGNLRYEYDKQFF